MSLAAVPANVSLLYVRGGDDADRAVRVGSRIKWTGTTDLHRLAEEPYHRLHVTRNLLRQARRPELAQYECIVNLIAEPERNARSLENLKKVLRGAPGKIVNRPEAVLRTTRDQVARLLGGIEGLIVPRVIRIPAGKAKSAARILEQVGLNRPIIVRQVGTHGGKILGLFDDVGDAAAAIQVNGDHLAIEFAEFRSGDGLYRKYRVFFIGGHRILRHLLVSDHWNIHANDRVRFMGERPELVAEERALFEATEPFAPGVTKVLEQVGQRMPLDFFGIDFGLTEDGSVVLFEANAAMSFFPLSSDPQFAHLQRALEPAQRAFRQLLGLSGRSSDAPHSRPLERVL